jgi:pSer/pThr/pTyr-binding forkhead associated (FHA) protein
VGRVLGQLKTPKGTIEIVTGETSIGRDPKLEVHVDDPAASWHHALISVSGNGLYVRDLGSRNGTYVNAEIVTTPRRLQAGDVIHTGNTDLVFGPLDEKAPELAERKLFLLVIDGPGAGRRILLESLPLILGRDDDVGVAGLEDQFISGRHLEISEMPDRSLVATDLGSLNGSLLNGSRMEPDLPTPLNTGDELRLGPKTSLRLERP